MKTVFVWVVDESRKVLVNGGILVTLVSQREGGPKTHAVITCPPDDHKEIHPVKGLFYMVVGD